MPLLDTLAMIAQSLSLSSHAPSRVIHDQTEPIATYHRRLSDLYQKSRYASDDRLNDVILDIVNASIATTGKMPVNRVLDGFGEFVHALIIENNLAFDFPKLDRRLIDEDNYALPLRRDLEGREAFLVHEAPIFESFSLSLHELICSIISDQLPASVFGEETKHMLTTPLAGSSPMPCRANAVSSCATSLGIMNQ
jgi:hypothetical protein